MNQPGRRRHGFARGGGWAPGLHPSSRSMSSCRNLMPSCRSRIRSWVNLRVGANSGLIVQHEKNADCDREKGGPVRLWLAVMTRKMWSPERSVGFLEDGNAGDDR